MGTKKDKYIVPMEWAKHFRKFLKRSYWKKSRQNSKKITKDFD